MCASILSSSPCTTVVWNIPEIKGYLASHPDVAYEEEMRSRGWIDFSTMDEQQFDDFLRWLGKLGYELAEYIDKDSGLLDTVWVK